MAILSSPGVDVSIDDQSQYAPTSAATIPLVVLATRTNKTLPNGTGTSPGTLESNVLRRVTSQREVLQTLGNPVFVTSGGAPVHGHESNEYGLHALWNFMAFANNAYYIRADIDLGQLISNPDAPLGEPEDGTFWIQSGSVVGGLFRRNATDTAWVAQTASVYLTNPGSSDGVAGDIAIDYSTANGTLKVKTDANTWAAFGSIDLTDTNIKTVKATNDVLWVGDTAPLGAGANDYWWKTSAASGGFDLKLVRYRASDRTWVPVTPIRSAIAPLDTSANTVWEDISGVASSGVRPLKIGNGSTFIALSSFVQATAPYRSPEEGTLWFSNDITDFAMYRESSNGWVEIATTTNSNPTASQKYISASAPTSPATGAIWIDISGANYENYPIIKRYTSAGWEDITASVSITDVYTPASQVIDGTFWINLGDPRTQNTVKRYDPTYQPTVLDNSGEPEVFDEDTHGRWRPFVGARFGRRATRYAVTRALQAAIVSNEDIRSEAVNYDLITVPGYAELFDEMSALSLEIDAFGISDVPARVIPSGVPGVNEMTITEWKINANSAETTGEDGFAAAGSPFVAHFYPWGMGTNVDGENVMIPPSTIALRTIAYSDSIGYPWSAPMGESAGLVNNASSVGYLSGTGEYKSITMNQGHRNILYDLNINPISFFHNIGLRIWGQKTSYGSASALDRINVARLILKVKKDLKRSMRTFIGKPADANTWGSARNLANRYLSGIKSLRGIVDSAVRCDENNNTPDRINRNEMWVDVAIKPMKAVEFIYVPIKLVDQGADI